jgi:predicted Rdx family selenoprotein
VRAASLVGEITEKLGVTATAIPGGKGQFDVLDDGRVLFSKQAEGRFPEHDEILAQIG